MPRRCASTLDGEGLRPIGEQPALSGDTVKTHLRNVFHTTCSHRQAERVRLLLAVTAQLSQPPM